MLLFPAFIRLSKKTKYFIFALVGNQINIFVIFEVYYKFFSLLLLLW